MTLNNSRAFNPHCTRSVILGGKRPCNGLEMCWEALRVALDQHVKKWSSLQDSFVSKQYLSRMKRLADTTDALLVPSSDALSPHCTR